MPLPLRPRIGRPFAGTSKSTKPLSIFRESGLPKALLAAALIALLSTSAPVQAEGDAAAGELLAFTCMGCHGIAGYRNAYPSYRVPKLGGQRAEYIVAALTAYKNGTRPHPTMQAQGGSLSAQDIEDLGAWFAGNTAADTVTADDVASLDAAKTCIACHGEGSEAVIPKPPVLSGQHADYLVHSLEQYKNGVRAGNVMLAFAAALTDEDMQRLAAFYSGRDGLYTPKKSN